MTEGHVTSSTANGSGVGRATGFGLGSPVDRDVGGIEAALERHRAVLDPAATVVHDVERLRSAAAIPARVRFSGHVYDVVTGLVQTVVPAGSRGEPSLAR